MCSANSKQLFYLKDMSLHTACLEEDGFLMTGNFRLTFHPLTYYNSIRGINLFKIYTDYNCFTIA